MQRAYLPWKSLRGNGIWRKVRDEEFPQACMRLIGRWGDGSDGDQVVSGYRPIDLGRMVESTLKHGCGRWKEDLLVSIPSRSDCMKRMQLFNRFKASSESPS